MFCCDYGHLIWQLTIGRQMQCIVKHNYLGTCPFEGLKKVLEDQSRIQDYSPCISTVPSIMHSFFILFVWLPCSLQLLNFSRIPTQREQKKCSTKGGGGVLPELTMVLPYHVASVHYAKCKVADSLQVVILVNSRDKRLANEKSCHTYLLRFKDQQCLK